MKRGKKLVALLMSLIMCFTFSSSVLATENTTIEKNIVTIVVPVNTNNNVRSTIYKHVEEPYVLESGTVTYTGNFTAPYRYFAFESSATGSSGSYSVALAEHDIISLASHSNNVNGGIEKTDWVTVTAGGSYSFIINNYTSSTITVNITYYSWS